jgi:hypothetical protein
MRERNPSRLTKSIGPLNDNFEYWFEGNSGILAFFSGVSWHSYLRIEGGLRLQELLFRGIRRGRFLGSLCGCKSP